MALRVLMLSFVVFNAACGAKLRKFKLPSVPFVKWDHYCYGLPEETIKITTWDKALNYCEKQDAQLARLPTLNPVYLTVGSFAVRAAVLAAASVVTAVTGGAGSVTQLVNSPVSPIGIPIDYRDKSKSVLKSVPFVTALVDILKGLPFLDGGELGGTLKATFHSTDGEERIDTPIYLPVFTPGEPTFMADFFPAQKCLFIDPSGGQPTLKDETCNQFPGIVVCTLPNSECD